MGRRLRTKLPVSKDILIPNFPTEGVQAKLNANQSNQKKYYNVATKRLPELVPNQPVLVQEKVRNWKPGTVINKSGPNDYNVLVDDTKYRRNRQQLRHFGIPSPNIETIPKENRSPDPEIVGEQEQLQLNLQEERSMSFQSFPTVKPSLPTTSSDYNKDSILTLRSRSGRIIKPPSRLDL